MPYVEMRMDRARATMELVMDEIERATKKHGPFNSAHEGYAVMLEEVDEVWDDVRADHPQDACYEAIQVAAMAIRFVVDCGRWDTETKWPSSGHTDPMTVPVLARSDKDENFAKVFSAVSGIMDPTAPKV